jgi:hypothetical protein
MELSFRFVNIKKRPERISNETLLFSLSQHVHDVLFGSRTRKTAAALPHKAAVCSRLLLHKHVAVSATDR